MVARIAMDGAPTGIETRLAVAGAVRRAIPGPPDGPIFRTIDALAISALNQLVV